MISFVWKGGPFLCRFLLRLIRSWWCFPSPCQAELRRLTIEAWYKPPCIGEHNTRLIVCKTRKRSVLGCHKHNALLVSCHLRNISQKKTDPKTELNWTQHDFRHPDMTICYACENSGMAQNYWPPTLDNLSTRQCPKSAAPNWHLHLEPDWSCVWWHFPRVKTTIESTFAVKQGFSVLAASSSCCVDVQKRKEAEDFVPRFSFLSFWLWNLLTGNRVCGWDL